MILTFSMRALSLLLLLCTLPGILLAHPHILDIDSGEEIGYQQLLNDLSDVQVIFIGESHDHAGHHRMQFEVIRGLKTRQVPVAIGLEMFQVDSQPELDRWVNREISETDFLRVYEKNWSWWPGYSPIFYYARAEKIPMAALNIPREIPRQVARNGFNSLAPELIKGIVGVPCVVDPAYEKFIRRALGDHSNEPENFIFFCEAQLLWDISMAKHLIDYIEKNPHHKVVVLAGNGHSWKHGIPSQVLKNSPLKIRVILPEVHGHIDRTNAKQQEADYLWLDFGAESWAVPDGQERGSG